MKKVIIIHGFKGAPNSGWKSWLMVELGKKGIWACAPSMPDSSNPISIEWVKEISRQVEMHKKDQIYLVGHSLGVTAILRYLEGTKAKNIKGAVLVSSPVFKSNKKGVANFFKTPFNYKSIKAKKLKFGVIHGDDDRSVSFDQGEFLAKELGSKLVVIRNGGHLNSSAGWKELPQCLAELARIMA